MICFKLDTETKFEFSMQISGDATPGSVPEIMFAIADGDRHHCFKATHAMNGHYCVMVPPMENVLKPGVYSGCIWVILGDRFYKPHSCEVEFKCDAKPVVNSVAVKTNEPTIAFGAITPSAPPAPVSQPELPPEEPAEQSAASIPYEESLKPKFTKEDQDMMKMLANRKK